MINKKCDVCNRNRFRFGNITLPIFLKGNTFFVCLECSLNYVSQILLLSDKDTEEWLSFVLRDNDDLEEGK